ncbi:hypothetical protein MRX96_015964 [Rhipicephalus microplus]
MLPSSFLPAGPKNKKRALIEGHDGVANRTPGPLPGLREDDLIRDKKKAHHIAGAVRYRGSSNVARKILCGDATFLSPLKLAEAVVGEEGKHLRASARPQEVVRAAAIAAALAA